MIEGFRYFFVLSFNIQMEDEYQSCYKGPLKNYVILLGGGGEVTKRLHKITRGEDGMHQKITLDKKGGGQFGSTLA